MVMALVSAAAAPMAIEATIGPLDPAAFGDEDLMSRAEEIARERFSANATLTVEDVWTEKTRKGTFGETIRADPGYVFYTARVRLENVGHLDISASTWQFSGVDAFGSDTSAELANAHDDFDASRIAPGRARAGVLRFEMPADSPLVAVHWSGDLAEASGPAPPARDG